VEAYRIKLFFNRFSIKCFVLAPDMPKNQFKSLIHFFHIGQFDILVVLQSGYSSQPRLKEVNNVLNFQAPEKYNNYKEAGGHVENEGGAEITLVGPDEVDRLFLYQNKMFKSFSRMDMLKCLPVIWSDLYSLHTRIEDVLETLNAKRVKAEKLNEVKKQLLSSKRLKEYFKQNPKEKEILESDLKKN